MKKKEQTTSKKNERARKRERRGKTKKENPHLVGIRLDDDAIVHHGAVQPLVLFPGQGESGMEGGEDSMGIMRIEGDCFFFWKTVNKQTDG